MQMNNFLTNNHLADEAETIRTLLAESDAALQTATEKALEAGQRLVEAKAECGHGQWLPFLARAGVPERKAQRYIKLAASGLKSDAVSDLGGIRGALEFLAKRDKAAKTLLAATDGGTLSLPLLSRALDMMDECAECFPEEMRGPILRHMPEQDVDTILERLDAIAPGCVEGDLEPLRLLACKMPELGEGLVVWQDEDEDAFNAGYVLPSREHPGYFYCLAAQGDSGVFSMRPICGGAVDSEDGVSRVYSIWEWFDRHLSPCRGEWRVETVPERIPARWFRAMNLDDALAEARADKRFGDASGIRLLIEQLPDEERPAA